MYRLTDKPWCNHTILEQGRLPVRTFFLPYADEAAVLADRRDRVMNLSGTWAFRWFPSALMVTSDVLTDSAAVGWDTIRVPRSWQMAGYGRFLYTDEAMPFPLDPPYVPAQGNETGVYRRTFAVTAAEGERYILRLDGVESCCEVYVNGSYAGYTQGSRLPAEFDVTPLCHSGENDLCLVVHQFCDGVYLEDQDMWWLGGIIRDVLLICRKQTSLRDILIDADYDAAEGTGLLRLRTELTGTGTASFRLLDQAGSEVLSGSSLTGNDAFTLPNVTPWNAEEPYLYTLLVTVKDAAGQTAEVTRHRVGFRRVEFTAGELRVNGRRIILRGVNRHEFSPEDGRVVSEERTREDLLLMKKHHINAVRTSHYPDMPAFYDLCDELGLYVVDECDLETHAFEIEDIPTRLVEDPEWTAAYLDRARRTIGRDRNHACVVMWSLGNESYWGSNFFAMYDWIHAEDPSRPVHYEGDRESSHIDVTGSMYTTIGDLYELDVSVSGKPHILCEFAHAMGNGPGSVEEYVEMMEHSRRIQGYFVWEWRDHGVLTTDAQGNRYYRYGGEFDENYHSGNFCMDGLLAADSTPTPGFFAYAHAVQPFHSEKGQQDTLTVTSRFAFHTVTAPQVHWVLRREGVKVAEVQETLAPLAPSQTATLPIPADLRGYARDNAHWTLTAVFTEGESMLGRYAQVLSRYVPMASAPAGALSVTAQGDGLTVAGKDFSLTVDFNDGRIRDYRAQGVLCMQKGPAPTFFRAYLDNDRIPAKTWIEKNLHSMTPIVTQVDWSQQSDGVDVTMTLRLGADARNWRVLCNVAYHISSDGTVCVQLDGRFDGDFGSRYGQEVPRIGTVMTLPGSLEQTAYCGYGPGESYCDSRAQCREDVFASTVTDMSFPYECPQDSGNRTGTTWIALHDGQVGMAFGSLKGLDVSAHHCTAKELWQARHAYQVPVHDFVELHMDLRNSGLGSGSCGPQHLRGYAAQTIPFTLSYAFTPFADGQPLAAARHAQDVLMHRKGGK